VEALDHLCDVPDQRRRQPFLNRHAVKQSRLIETLHLDHGVYKLAITVEAKPRPSVPIIEEDAFQALGVRHSGGRESMKYFVSTPPCLRRAVQRRSSSAARLAIAESKT
jgi:hypothetical protein